MDEIYIQRVYTATDVDGDYTDHILLPQAEYEKLTEEDIEAIKTQRASDWAKRKEFLADPVYTDEELLAQKQELQARITEIDSKLQVTPKGS